MKETIQRIWHESKRFILYAGGGFAAFLILKACAIDGLHASAGKLYLANQDAQNKVYQLQEQVFRRYGEEKKSLEDLAAIEKDLRARYLTAAPQDVPDRKRGGSPQIQFSERIDRLWNELKEKANKKNVRIPEKITTTELGVLPQNDTPEDHERSVAYLEILGRALHACIDQGIVDIKKPVIHAEEAQPIRGNDGMWAIYRRVTLPADGPYESFRRTIREFERPGSYLQVRLLSLDAKGSGGAGALRGQLEFVGIHFVKEGEEARAAPEEPGEKTPKQAPRRKKR